MAVDRRACVTTVPGKRIDRLCVSHSAVTSSALRGRSETDGRVSQTIWTDRPPASGPTLFHFGMTSRNGLKIISKDRAADIRSYDAGHAHLLIFADTLTVGITKQFPAKFR